jgi:hypothetical protein
MQLWLSQKIKVTSNSRSNNHASNFRSHTTSLLAKHVAIYYASVVLSATPVCFLLSHQIIADPKLKQHPDVLFRSVTLSSISSHASPQSSEHISTQPYTDSMFSPQRIYLASCSSSTSTNQSSICTWWHPLSLKKYLLINSGLLLLV